jgi:hypothetical protein
MKTTIFTILILFACPNVYPDSTVFFTPENQKQAVGITIGVVSTLVFACSMFFTPFLMYESHWDNASQAYITSRTQTGQVLILVDVFGLFSAITGYAMASSKE